MQAESGIEFKIGRRRMKVAVFGLVVSLLAAFTGAAQDHQPPPSSHGPTLSHQTQPSEVEKAKSTLAQPKLQPQITYSGPLADLSRGENPLRPRQGKNVVRAAYDDITVDVITRRPRGIVLFAVNF
jgi:hypothetical protein